MRTTEQRMWLALRWDKLVLLMIMPGLSTLICDKIYRETESENLETLTAIDHCWDIQAGMHLVELGRD